MQLLQTKLDNGEFTARCVHTASNRSKFSKFADRYFVEYRLETPTNHIYFFPCLGGSREKQLYPILLTKYQEKSRYSVVPTIQLRYFRAVWESKSSSLKIPAKFTWYFYIDIAYLVRSIGPN